MSSIPDLLPQGFCVCYCPEQASREGAQLSEDSVSFQQQAGTLLRLQLWTAEEHARGKTQTRRHVCSPSVSTDTITTTVASSVAALVIDITVSQSDFLFFIYTAACSTFCQENSCFLISCMWILYTSVLIDPCKRNQLSDGVWPTVLCLFTAEFASLSPAAVIPASQRITEFSDAATIQLLSS